MEDRFAEGSTPAAGLAASRPPQAGVWGAAAASAMDEGEFPGTADVDVAKVFAQPGYTAAPPASNALAHVALWMSVVGLVLAPLLLVSLLLGAVAILPSRDRRGVGVHQALAALVLSLVGLVLWSAILGLLFSMV